MPSRGKGDSGQVRRRRVDADRLLRRIAALEAESDELRDVRRTLEGLMRNLPGMCYRCRNDRARTMSFVSEGSIALTGYYPDDFLGNRSVDYGDLIHPDDRRKVWRTVQAALKRKGSFHMTYRIVGAEGQVRWVWEQGRGVYAKERLLALEGFITDVTERKRTEEALRASEERFRELFRQMSTGVMVYEVAGDGQDFIIKDVNPAGERIDKVRKRDIVGRQIQDVFPGVSQFGLLAAFRRVWQTGKPEHLATALYRDERISGWRNNSVYKLPSGEVVSLFDDVTEQRVMENRILAKQRMDAIGELAGGIATDFKNLLAVMTGHTAAILEHMTPNTKAHEAATQLLEAERYAGRLTKRLLSVARASDVRGETRIEPVALGYVLQETVALIQHISAEKGIECQIRHPDDMPHVMADETQLRDVVMNLLLNSVKALPSGGLIRIDADTREIGESAHMPNADAVPGPYAVVRFRDNGAGIPREVLGRIFDPFFTTDESGASMGLGLCIVQSAVHHWGGWVRVRSRVGVGASFRLFIPLAPSPDEKGDRATGRDEGTVLVVDDQEECRTWMCRQLRNGGYRTIEVASGDEAVAVFREHADRISVSLVDVVMPGVDGKGVLEAIVESDPTAQVVMMSGFSHDYVRGYLERGMWSFLQKPFEAPQLMNIVKQLSRRSAKSNKIAD